MPEITLVKEDYKTNNNTQIDLNKRYLIELDV